MKDALTISILLIFMIIGSMSEARSFQVPATSHKQEKICNEARLLSLAACGCYVQATVSDAPKEEMDLCQQQFGDDLLSLKPYCEGFLESDDEVDVDAFTDAIVEVQGVCLPQLVENGRIATAGKVVVKHSERFLPFVIAAIIILYPTNAY